MVGALKQQLESNALSSVARAHSSSPFTLGYRFSDALNWSRDPRLPKSYFPAQQSSGQPVALCWHLFFTIFSLWQSGLALRLWGAARILALNWRAAEPGYFASLMVLMLFN